LIDNLGLFSHLTIAVNSKMADNMDWTHTEDSLVVLDWCR